MIRISGYLPERRIYTGANSVLYRGIRESDRLPVVIKLPNKSVPTSEELERFRREYDIMRSLHSDKIVRALALTRAENSMAMVMEDFGGESVSTILADWAFALPPFLDLSISIAEALGQIHQRNVIHKDINPDNIIWNPEYGQIKITDFGIAMQAGPASSEAIDRDTPEGTLAYISPEQTGRTSHVIDYRTDYYSLGVTLYRIATGRLPFESEDPVKLVHSHIAIHPVSPHQLNDQLPPPVSAVIMKLLAKNADDRYQSIYGLKADLQECLKQLCQSGSITDFEIGSKDTLERFKIPEKIFGREHVIHNAVETFNRAAAGEKETLLLSGEAGIGKSTAANQIITALDAKDAFCLYGKFDQFQRNIPYSAMIQAFQALAGQIAAMGRSRVVFWGEKLNASLAGIGKVITELIPLMESIIGKQPDLPGLPPVDAQSRLNMAFLNMIRTFQREKQPLVLCIEDLQWADEASLELIEILLSDPEMGYLLFVGTYRGDEIDDQHPLSGVVSRIEKSGSSLECNSLRPLELGDVNRFLAEIFTGSENQTEPLARLCLEKTRGNPFFLIQLLKTLFNDGHLYFDHEDEVWRWDIDAIGQAKVTENVVDLLLSRIHKLPESCRDTLKSAACIGSRFDLRCLALTAGQSPDTTADLLKPAIEEGLISPTIDETGFSIALDQENTVICEVASLQDLNLTYHFQHDRITQAVYSLTPDHEKAKTHAIVGYFYLHKTTDQYRQEALFDIVNHLNAGLQYIRDPEKKLELTRLNLRAGQKAKAAAAFAPSLKYFRTGLDLLPPGSWTNDYALTFELYTEAAESALLCTDFAGMEALADSAVAHARTPLDKATLSNIKIQGFYAKNDLLKVIDEGLGIIKMLGYPMPKKPSALAVIAKLLNVKITLARISRGDIEQLEDITDPEMLAALRIMIHMGHAAYGARPKLSPLLVFKGIMLSLKNGIAPETPFSFAGYGMFLISLLGQIDEGQRLGELALALKDRPSVRHYTAKTVFLVESMIRPWRYPLRGRLAALSANYETGVAIGDFEYATLSAFFYCAYAFYSGRELNALLDEMASYSNEIQRFKQTTHFYFNQMARQTVLNLMMESDDPCRLIGSAYNETEMLPVHRKNNDTSAIHMLFSYKLQLCYLFGRYSDALASAETVEAHLESMIGTFFVPVFHFYDSLVRLALFSSVSRAKQHRFSRKISRNQRKLKKWAKHAPANFLHKWQIVEAERLKTSGSGAEAVEYYDSAIELAEKNAFIQEAALASELATSYWFEKQNREVAAVYLAKAIRNYKSWGADAKVKSLEKKHAGLQPGSPRPSAVREFRTTRSDLAETMDMESILKSSRAISGEIVVEKLMETLLSVVIENAGAQKALLISQNDNQWIIDAEGHVSDKGVAAQIHSRPAQPTDIAFSILNFISYTHESVLLDNAAWEGDFVKDPYIKEKLPKSILGTPILHQGKLRHVLYLENNLTTGVFTAERLGLLHLIASQAAISLENAGLYARLRESEKKYRGIFENAVEGIFQVTPEGRFINSNRSMASILGYASPEALMNSIQNVLEEFFEDPADRGRFVQNLFDHRRVVGFETVGKKADGSRFWGALSARTIRDADGNISYVEGSLIDITDRKKREKAEREREAAKATADAKSEFLANMSHEIRTPMNAIIGLTELASKTALSDKQLEYMTKIREASGTLLQIIDDILDFSRIEAGRLELEKSEFRLSDIIDKINLMFANLMMEKGIDMIFSIDESIPGILIGDSLRLEQVLMNLVSNAFKFTDNGEISIEARLLQKTDELAKIEFCVADTGIGIPEEHMSALFQPFTQADSSITRRYGGTGLGLAISKTIVDKFNGRIWLESEVGQGSRFQVEVELPYIEATLLRRRKEPLSSETAEEISGVRLLLVEDNPINRQIIAEVLESMHARVDAVEDGRAAIDAVNERDYDAVLMDVQMPGMDGYATTRKIRESSRSKDLPIIALTAHALPGYREKCIAAGMNDYVTKPVDFDELMSKIAIFVDGSKLAEMSMLKVQEDAAPENPIRASQPLSGINLEAGLKRMGGRRHLYELLVREFYQDYKDIVPLLKKAQTEGDQNFINRTAHTVKGLAGHIGAENLKTAAEKLETGEESDDGAPDADAIAHFEAHLNTVLDDIKRIEPDFSDAAPASGGETAAVDLPNVLSELYHLLSEGQSRAAAYFESVYPHMQHKHLAASLKLLQQHIVHYDFEEARHILEQIAATLNITIKDDDR